MIKSFLLSWKIQIYEQMQNKNSENGLWFCQWANKINLNCKNDIDIKLKE